MRTVTASIVVFSLLHAACGTGGSGGGDGPPPPPPFALVAPNGGGTWVVGSTATVTWEPGTLVGPVDLEISTDSGATWGPLSMATANDGTEVVAVPATPSTTVRVQVSAADGDSLVATAPADSSDADFEIVSPFVDAAAGLPGIGSSTPMGSFTALAWGDFDADGDLDLALAGLDTSFATITRIYRNDAGTFVDVVAPLPGLGAEGGAALAWGDMDKDGDLDLVMAGLSPVLGGTITRIYRNDGGVFADSGAGLPGVGGPTPFGGACDLALGDFDVDGDLDIALTGISLDLGFLRITRVYRNDDGTYVDIDAGLPGLGGEGGASLAWGDMDNDGDLDLVIAGFSFDALAPITRVYRNDDGVFTDAYAGLPGLSIFTSGNAIALGDYDADGDLDVALAGATLDGGFVLLTRVYRNDGGVFVDAEAGLPGLGAGGGEGSALALAWGDYDADGDLDLALSGTSPDLGFATVTRVYRNDGGTFADVEAGLPGVGGFMGASLAWGDFDRDGRLDLALAGAGPDTGFTAITRIYRNVTLGANTPPAAPTNLAYLAGGGELLLTWDAASDAETPAAGLSYNLWIGATTSDDGDYPRMAADDGVRLIPAAGPFLDNPFTVSALLALEPGIYFVRVQAIDSGFEGGAWTDPIPVVVP